MHVQKLSFRPDIQGLRAIAVLLVLFYHAGVPGLDGGYIGVDVFFVISGFLITAHLLHELTRDGRVSIGCFYARRIQRILPAAVVVLAASLAASALFIPPLLLPRIFVDAVYTAVYVPNIHFARSQVDYLSDKNPSVFQHYWSLGVEEQFYLVWPVGILLAWLLSRRSLRVFAAVLAAVALLSFAGSVWVTWRAQPYAFFMMPSRAWEFAVGGLIAVLVTACPFRLGEVWAVAARWLGMAGLLAGAVVLTDETRFPGVAATIPVCAAALIIMAGDQPGRRASGGDRPAAGPCLRLLTARPVLVVGAMSYSLYLVHWPLLVIPQIVAGDQNQLSLGHRLLLVAVAFPIAWGMFRWVETPFLERRMSAGAALSRAVAVTSVLALVATGAHRGVLALPLHTDTVVSARPAAARPVETPVVPVNLVPPLREAADAVPKIYAMGCHVPAEVSTPKLCRFGDDLDAPHVVLFGDSHAAQWFPALVRLSEEGTIRLSSFTKSSCSAFTPAAGSSCSSWRSTVTATINEQRPDLVVLAAYVGDEPLRPQPDVWERSLRTALAQFRPDIAVAVMVDTPQFDMSPAACLSKHVRDVRACGSSPELALSADLQQAERAGVEEHGDELVDMTDYFCSDDWCPVITGQHLMYRDAHHISASYSATLGTALWERLEPLVRTTSRRPRATT